VWALRKEGYETIIVNCNPETVSTDFDTADKLYFEPLTPEDIEHIVHAQKPDGCIVQFGGQTAIKLTKTLSRLGVPIMGTSEENIDAAEDREKFDKILEKCGIPRPAGKTVFTKDEALEAAWELGYPVLVRPSYVLGGQGMEIAFNDYDIIEFMEIINRVKQEHPILIDKYLLGKEIEVDAICDGEDLLIPGIMEHLERAGVHSGDSISVYPPQRLRREFQDVIVDYTSKLAKALNVVGLVNIQFVLYDDQIYVIEVNPRSSRTIPYISKVTNVPMVDLALQCVLGKKLKGLGYKTGLYKESEYKAVKVPVFSFEKLHGVETSLGPEMKSTGEVLGISKDFGEALYKGLIASGLKIPTENASVLITVRDTDKDEAAIIAKQLHNLGFIIYATENTAAVFTKEQIPTKIVSKIGEGSPDILDMIQARQFDLVINTPTKGRRTERDGFKMRRLAVELSIPCLTSLDTAAAFIRCIIQMKSNIDTSIVDITKI
jgi:carbamoyl-phosphate synthase large subunit